MRLQPCPFCGGNDLDEEATGAMEIRGYAIQRGWVECSGCGACGPSIELTDETPQQNDYQIVRDAWNRRARAGASDNPSDG